MGDIDVTDMMSYMQALSKFNKGDSTKVQVYRNKKKIKLDIIFQ